MILVLHYWILSVICRFTACHCRSAEAESRRAAIEAKRKSLIAFNENSQEYTALEQDLTRMTIEFEVWANLQEKRLKDEHKRWLLRIYNNVKEAVSAIAATSHIDLVLTYEQLIDEAPDSITLRQQILLKKVIFRAGLFLKTI